ncbi:hypothetical protein N7491_009910 [Penicillium cf. griseofulvum]|nr:hypothetical protein N7491_009910 [Penicillium cf. griseofulvum]
MEERRPNKRKRTTLACNACRARRTKCDSQKPSCSYCQTHRLDCLYQEAPAEPPSRTYIWNSVEVELNAVNKRLDQLISLMLPAEPISPDVPVRDPPTECRAFTDKENSPFDLPSKLLGNSSVMHALGLHADFAQVLAREERATGPEGHANAGTRMLIVHHQHARIGCILGSRSHLVSYFSLGIFGGVFPSTLRSLTSFFRIMPFPSCGRSRPHSRGNEAVPYFPYFETALTSLPIIIAECSIRSVQCLMLISLYYCCLLKPYQAHDYCLIAASKIQNMIKIGVESDDLTAVEQSRLAYWGALLLENEIGGQLDVANSGIWCLDEHVPLPLCHQTWEFGPESTSPAIAAPASSDSPSSNASVQNMRSYFLAEIAMRRMLHRCNTAVQVTPAGKYVYAPGIAIELERQLEEWYRYLPEKDRFRKGDVLHPLEAVDLPSCPLSNFLRVQYYCCKVSIYWPAVYQAMQDGTATNLLLDHCQRFFDSYVMLIPGIVAAFNDCRVNRWTLFISLFITSVAAMTAANAPCLNELCSPQLYQRIKESGRAEQTIVRKSSSLVLVQGVLEERLSKSGFV